MKHLHMVKSDFVGCLAEFCNNFFSKCDAISIYQGSFDVFDDVWHISKEMEESAVLHRMGDFVHCHAKF